MIYFKITDKESIAWERHRQYENERREAALQANDLREDIGVESEHGVIVNGSLKGFEYQDEHTRPTGMLIKDGKLVPNEKSEWGQKIAKAMDQVHIPTSADYMRRIFGVAGEAIEKGSHYYSGCGLACNDEIVLIAVRVTVWNNAREMDDFEIPEGVDEITGSEYQDLRAKILNNE